ncbi:MAG: hypothetical protein ACTHV2_02650 [Brachybacterium sp.]|nr:hypothetical protein [Brachybacterium sp.]
MNATARSTSRIVRGLAAASLITALAAGCQFGIGEDEQPTGGSDPAVEQGEDPAGDGSDEDQQDPQASDGGSEGAATARRALMRRTRWWMTTPLRQAWT